ncbi:hypothetical protein ACS0TY_034244 [Phlomoides rotata]
MPEGGKPREILMLQPDLDPVRGCSEGGIMMSKIKRKAEVRALKQVETKIVPPKKNSSCPLTFSEDDLEGILTPNNDPLIINAKIMGTKVH